MTQLEIINLALVNIGNVPITQAQLTANTIPSAIAANLYWEPLRDEVLGEARWSFATTTLALSALDTIDDVVWTSVYSYPTLSVGTIWNVFNVDTVTDKEDQQFEIKYIPSLGVKGIFTDLEEAYGEYTYKVTDTEIWNDKFNIAFSYRLSASMCMYLTGDSDKANNLMMLYSGIVGEAKRLGFHEKKSKPYRDSGYINAR